MCLWILIDILALVSMGITWSTEGSSDSISTIVICVRVDIYRNCFVPLIAFLDAQGRAKVEHDFTTWWAQVKNEN